VLSEAGAPVSWTSERADTPFVCEQVRKAAATKRQPQRGGASNVNRSEPARLSSASDDKVGGLQSAIRGERSEPSNTVPPMGFEPMLERV
jgi:hypothetical protein